MDQNSFKQHFPGLEWTLAAEGANARVGCFWLSLKKNEGGYFTTAECFIAQGLAPIYKSTDLPGQSLEDALTLLSHWCEEQGELMMRAVSSGLGAMPAAIQ